MISIKNLSKTHINNRHSKVLALDNISIDLPSTGLVLLNGESGSGKTTLLSILGGLDTFDKGSFTIDGNEISGFTQDQLDDWRGKQTAFIFQAFNLISSYNVSDNIKLGKNFQGLECSDEEVAEVLKNLNLEGYENRYLKDLSGGENQRVAIARALVRSPRVLIVDEPTGQIDEENSHKIMKILDRISEKTLVVCVSHETALVSQYADRVITLKNGKILSDKTLSKAPKHEKTLLAKSEHKPVIKHRQLFNLGLLNLMTNKFRTAAMILLTCFSLLFFSTFFMLSSYDRSLALATSAKLEEAPYVVFENKSMKATDYRDISEFSDVSLYKYVPVEWDGGIMGVVAQDPPAGEYTRLGLRLTAGVYPEDTTANAFEIVLTDYIADKIIAGSLNLYDNNTLTVDPEELKTFDDLLGSYIKTNDIFNIYLKIAGVVETDYASFGISPTGNDLKRYNSNLENIYSVVYTSPSFLSTVLLNGNDETKSLSKVSGDIYVKELGSLAGDINGATVMNYAARTGETLIIARHQDGVNNEEDVSMPLTGTVYDATTLAPHSIIVSQDIYDQFIARPDNGGQLASDGGWGRDSKYINIKFGSGQNRKFTVVAVITDAQITNTVMIGNKAYNNNNYNPENDNEPYGYGILRDLLFPTTKLLLPIGDLAKEQVASLIIKIENTYDFVYQSSAASMINDFSDKLNSFTTALLVFGIFSLVFSCFLLYNFVLNLILEKRKDIAILRSMGATSGDITAILYVTVGAIAFACFIISSILTIFMSLIVNSIIQTSLAMPFAIISMTPGVFGVIFVICLAVAAFATVVPVYKHASQTPVKQLKG